MKDLDQFSILIIDSKKDLADRLSLELSSTTFSVYTAYNSETAFEILSKEKIQFVICELDMPDISGFNFLNRCKILPQMPYFIFFTTESNQEKSYIYEYLYHGVLAFFKMPCDLKNFNLFLNYYIENEIKSPFHPRRKHIRLRIPNLLGDSNAQNLNVDIDNIALGGMCLKVSNSNTLKLNELVNFSLCFKNKLVQLDGLCKWIKKLNNEQALLGMQFINLNSKNQEVLANMINSYLTKDLELN